MDPLKFLHENPTPSELPFIEEEFQGRIAKMRKLMGEAGLEALQVTHLPNLYYLTGYNTIIPNRYACLVLPIEGEPTIHIADVELGAVFATGWVRDVELYQTFARYNQWMNEKLYAVCAEIDDGERKRDRGAFFKSIHGTLNHLLFGDRAWLGRFTGNWPRA